jgi:acyl-CoA hydrolase
VEQALSLVRSDDVIVTGVAELRGISLRERVARLIEIAHPKFREELWEQAVAVGILGKRR